MKKPRWDDGDIDPGIRDVVEALDRLPGVETIESCEGHGRHPESFVIFFYKDGKEVPPWTERVLNVGKRTGLCLGCLHLELEGDYHFDCANDLKKGWWLRVYPSHKYPAKSIRADMMRVWAEIVMELNNCYQSVKEGK